MTTQTEDQIEAGRAHAVNVLKMIAAAHGDDAGRAMAAGLITGIRDHLVARYGRRDAYALIQGMADSCINPQLAADTIEAEIREAVRGLRRKA
jgi:hypothetical protein